ncbi:hypothetical protein TSUD_61590 [Trifolium subterraneum]|uniref:Uncharacterized protein n=1 Tax=Trifolium subterraneum TaxID=3900 RepID=A0A2Z6NT08_TRISU|nr:hypothetical protein TSUD_61590 [Trifolium subterraneum]
MGWPNSYERDQNHRERHQSQHGLRRDDASRRLWIQNQRSVAGERPADMRVRSELQEFQRRSLRVEHDWNLERREIQQHDTRDQGWR